MIAERIAILIASTTSPIGAPWFANVANAAGSRASVALQSAGADRGGQLCEAALEGRGAAAQLQRETIK